MFGRLKGKLILTVCHHLGTGADERWMGGKLTCEEYGS